MTVAIRFEHVSKCYQLGTGRVSFREAITETVKSLLRGSGKTSKRADTLWALHDVSFEVRSGEALGIIGPNGAGKTTILKLLSRITKPTAGQIAVSGRLSALIELGAGFHPDLTGRENVYLNGAILGLSQKEIDRKFDSIVEFAGLERFMDTPVKRYSSGMYARLGFAIAIHVDPDILLVDEVLAVGDQTFQARCVQRMREFRRNARAIVFVSHNLVAVRELCDRALWLSNGKIQSIGKPGEVIEAYRTSTFWQRSSMAPESTTTDAVTDTGVRITGVRILDKDGIERSNFEVGEPLIVRIAYMATRPIRDPTFAISVWRQDGFKCGETSNLQEDTCLGTIVGQGEVEFRFDDPRLMPERYHINVAISDRYLVRYDHVSQASQFAITSSKAGTFGITGPFRFPGRWKMIRVEEGSGFTPSNTGKE